MISRRKYLYNFYDHNETERERGDNEKERSDCEEEGADSRTLLANCNVAKANKKCIRILTENRILKCERGHVKFVMRIIYIMQGIDVSSVKLLLEISKVLPS